mmetsp:Transcript_73963/g.207604  ORF Transcript_73963/g.207604 Transcript_73963/m.207604 type:complete len:102 (-) Transcript_73963:123-428(-)
MSVKAGCSRMCGGLSVRDAVRKWLKTKNHKQCASHTLAVMAHAGMLGHPPHPKGECFAACIFPWKTGYICGECDEVCGVVKVVNDLYHAKKRKERYLAPRA